MKPTLNEKLIAYLALLSGLALSVVAEYYSISGLTSIFAAAVIPSIIMGIALGVGKVTATIWLKQNWKIAPLPIRLYLSIAIGVLMIVTAIGIFGFLSKAHSDQSLVSGDVLAKIAVYDEKIKIAKENIDANRKALKQMDEAVDQVMARSSSETGADKAVGIRRSQQKERTRLQSEIQSEQRTITALSEERAPIAAEVRKVEAEVGPIKYIAAFVYGKTDPTILEKAVTWVIVTIIIVFDPLALILLLSSQISFQDFRKRLEEDKFAEWTEDDFDQIAEDNLEKYDLEELKECDSSIGSESVVDNQKLTVTEQDEKIKCEKCSTELMNVPSIGLFCPNPKCNEPVASEESILDKHPYLLKGFDHFENLKPLVYVPEITTPVERIVEPPKPVIQQHETTMRRTKVFPVVRPALDTAIVSETYIQNEEQAESNLWSNTTTSNTEVEQVAYHVANIISGRTTSGEVPEHIWEQVNAQVEQHASDILAGKMHTGEVPEHLWEQVKAKL